jgi:hypothetical protein
VDDGAQFEEALGHTSAETGASAGDENALVFQKICAEHGKLGNWEICNWAIENHVGQTLAINYSVTKLHNYSFPRADFDSELSHATRNP